MEIQERIRQHRTFEEFLRKELAEELPEIAEHGCGAGWAYLTYYSDTCALYDAYESEIDQKLAELAEEFGYKSVIQWAAERTEIDGAVTLKNWMVWAFVEDFAQTFESEELPES
jgi:hypothetical protein